MINVDKNAIERFKYALIGIASALFLYLSFSMATISHGRLLFQTSHLLLVFFSYILFSLFGNKIKMIGESKQYFYIVIILFFVSVLLWISTIVRYICHFGFGYKLDLTDASGYQFASQTIFVISMIREIWINKLHRGFKQIITLILRHKYIVMLILFAMALSYSPWSYPFKYDGALYYIVSKEASLYSLSSLSFYGHMAQGSGLIVTYFMDIVARNSVLAWYLANAFAIGIGGMSFYLLLKRLVIGKNEFLYVLMTAIYLFSPFVLGMSGYASVDFFCANLFLPVLFFTFEEKWLLQMIFGTIYACTKEPGFMIYGALCMVVLLVDIYDNKKAVLTHCRYWGMVLVAFLWGATLLMIGVWNAGDSSAGIDLLYIVYKAKSLFVLNFSWLLLIVIVLGGKLGFLRNRRILYILCPLAVFLIFSFYYNAGNHARYTDIVPVCLHLLASIVILKIGDIIPIASYGIGTVLFVIMVLSTYFTIDPVSIVLFNKIVSSSGVILSTDMNNALPGDASLYNRQGLYLEKSYSQMIGYGLDNNYIIVTNAYFGNTYYLDGIMEVGSIQSGNYYVQKEYWNSLTRKRSNDVEKSDMSFDIYALKDIEAFEKLASEKKGCKIMYSYMEGADGDISSDIKEKFMVLESESFSSNGWKINVIIIET